MWPGYARLFMYISSRSIACSRSYMPNSAAMLMLHSVCCSNGTHLRYYICIIYVIIRQLSNSGRLHNRAQQAIPFTPSGWNIYYVCRKDSHQQLQYRENCLRPSHAGLFSVYMSILHEVVMRVQLGRVVHVCIYIIAMVIHSRSPCNLF